MSFELDFIKQHDPEIAAAIQGEIDRQETHIELIASENFASKAVQMAQGTALNDATYNYTVKFLVGSTLVKEMSGSMKLTLTKKAAN